MRPPLPLVGALVGLAACATDPTVIEPGFDGGFDAPPIRPMELDAPPSVDVTVTWDAQVVPADVTRVVPTAASRLTVAELSWNPTNAAVGTVAGVADRLRSATEVVDLLIPFDRGDVIAEAHREGEVLAEGVTEGGMALTARLDEAAAAKLAPWVIG